MPLRAGAGAVAVTLCVVWRALLPQKYRCSGIAPGVAGGRCRAPGIFQSAMAGSAGHGPETGNTPGACRRHSPRADSLGAGLSGTASGWPDAGGAGAAAYFQRCGSAVQSAKSAPGGREAVPGLLPAAAPCPVKTGMQCGIYGGAGRCLLQQHGNRTRSGKMQPGGSGTGAASAAPCAANGLAASRNSRPGGAAALPPSPKN